MNFFHLREQALDKHDQALANWPNRTGESFLQAMTAVIAIFKQLLHNPAADIAGVIHTLYWPQTLARRFQ